MSDDKDTNQFSVQNTAAAYDLLKEILSDLRGASFKERKAKRQRLSQLFKVIQTFHREYAIVFIDLLNDAKCARDFEEVRLGVERFDQKRRKNSPARFEAYSETQAWLGLDFSDQEMRFLDEVANFLNSHSITEIGAVPQHADAKTKYRTARVQRAVTRAQLGSTRAQRGATRAHYASRAMDVFEKLKNVDSAEDVVILTSQALYRLTSDYETIVLAAETANIPMD